MWTAGCCIRCYGEVFELHLLPIDLYTLAEAEPQDFLYLD